MYAFYWVTGFTMEIPVPKSVQYLDQYVQKTDFCVEIIILKIHK